MLRTRAVPAVLWAVVAGLALGAAIVRGPAVVALAVPTLVMALLLGALHRLLLGSREPDEARHVLWWTCMAFGGHLLLGLVIANSSALVAYLGGDAVTYHQWAIRLVHHWTAGGPTPVLPRGKEGFYFLLAVLYWVFGPHQVAGIVVNAALGAAVIPLVYDTTRRLFGRAAAWYVPPTLALLPGIVLFSSQLLKEAPVLFLIAVVANVAVRLVDRTTLLASGVLAGSLALLFAFRGPIGLMTAGSTVVALAFGRNRLLTGLWTGACAALLLAVLVLAVGVGNSGYQAAVGSNLEHVQNTRQDSATSSATGYDVSADVSTVGGAITYLPKGMISFLLGPYPWQLHGLRRLPLMPDVLIWWALLPSLWRGLRGGWARYGRRVLTLALPAFAVSVVISLAIGNFGTIVRERMQVVVLLAPVIGYGLSLRKSGDEEPDAVPAARQPGAQPHSPPLQLAAAQPTLADGR